jgi:hypothetical protein
VRDEWWRERKSGEEEEEIWESVRLHVPIHCACTLPPQLTASRISDNRPHVEGTFLTVVFRKGPTAWWLA